MGVFDETDANVDAAGRLSHLLEDCDDFEGYMRPVFEAFLAFDDDRTGYLDLKQFGNLLSTCNLLRGLEPYDGLELEEFINKMFSEADDDKDDLLSFYEFARCYHNIWKRREAQNLPEVEVTLMVVSYLEDHKNLNTVKQLEDPKWRLVVPPKPDRRTKAIKFEGEQSTVTLVVDVFQQTAGPKSGSVQSQAFLSNMAAAGAVTASSRTLPADLDIVEAVKLLLPTTIKPRILEMVEVSKRYLQARNAENDLRAQKSDLYDTIKENRVQVTIEDKKEALSMFAAFDKDRDRHLNLKEFCAALSCACETDDAEELFELVDIFERGKVNAFEFVAVIVYGVETGVREAEPYALHLLGLLEASISECDIPLDALLRHPLAAEAGLDLRRRSLDDRSSLDGNSRRGSLDGDARRGSLDGGSRRGSTDGGSRHGSTEGGSRRGSLDGGSRGASRGSFDESGTKKRGSLDNGNQSLSVVHEEGSERTQSKFESFISANPDDDDDWVPMSPADVQRSRRSLDVQRSRRSLDVRR